MASFTRSAGRITHTNLNAAEKRAVNDMVSEMIREASQSHEKEELAIVAWELRQRLGWGEKRIADFMRDYYKELKKLNTYYQVDKPDTPWLCSQMLVKSGIDWDKIYQSIEGSA